MQFIRIGEFLAVSRVTGPAHNLLQLKVTTAPVASSACEPLPAIGSHAPSLLNEALVVAAVAAGLSEANARFGTSYAASHIRYVVDDSFPESVYAHLASALITHLACGGTFNTASHGHAPP